MSVSASAGPIPATVSTADAPGPPGFTISVPIFLPVAGIRITANCACAPCGFAESFQSTGTVTVPHWAVGIDDASTHDAQLLQTGGCPNGVWAAPSGVAWATG